MSDRPLRTSDFDFHLPQEQVAQLPAERRDRSRLLVLDRASGGTRHLHFADLAELVPPGDALVLNETRVFPARRLGSLPLSRGIPLKRVTASPYKHGRGDCPPWEVRDTYGPSTRLSIPDGCARLGSYGDR